MFTKSECCVLSRTIDNQIVFIETRRARINWIYGCNPLHGVHAFNVTTTESKVLDHRIAFNRKRLTNFTYTSLESKI